MENLLKIKWKIYGKSIENQMENLWKIYEKSMENL